MLSSSTTEPKLAFTSLCIWPAYGALPSFDPECLCVLAHFAFSRLNADIKTNLGRFAYMKEHLPLLLGDSDKICLASGYEAIADHCKKSHIDIDEQFSTDTADLLALNALVKSAFVPAVLDTFWLDDTYRTAIINIYGRSLGGFPLAFIYGKQTTERIKNQFSITYGDNNFEQTRKIIFEKGKKVLDHLTLLLGTKPFLFGASPTSVDAFVFGYLAPLIHGPASNSGLARYASSRKNLRDFVNRILTVYLGHLATDNQTTDSAPTTVPKKPTEDRLRDKLAVIGVGILTMCAYAYFSGLIRIEISQVE
ncbi:unnamed protein product [Adineta steineri]|uniref:Metaxin n=1 Tax=Adineta steineri TaxID=433720 RepID=A0A818UX06_9BILA|nr:unnamed protein product [Adineta steineri]CAF0947452.1 unnamed protein product [Adineta steineri]CAF3516826.1 unnamed protein product [Adineta steineri]CAF3697960.1 unnamed protein product [Adineta steineri]